MKTLVLALGIVSLALTVTASPREGSRERHHWVGRHEYSNDDVPQVSVPDASSTMGLAAIGLASLSLAGICKGRRKA